jgi:DNA-binding SARP family transcriptional activator/WD40 repeat protein
MDPVPPSSSSLGGTEGPVSDVESVGQSGRMRGLAPRVEFCALGPVGVIVDGQPVTLGSPKLRTVLAALLVEVNSVVSSDRLVDILWGDDPPVSSRATLQKLVYRLRLVVEPDRGSDRFLVTRAPGYVLRVGPEQYDAARFDDHLRTARAQVADGAVAAAVASLDTALGLWRGPAFAEFAYDDFARAEATRLEELRVIALEDRVDAKLTLGHHEEVVGELERLVDAHPLRERSRAQLMLALYRAGRQVEALRAYQDHRRYLIDELGIEPSAALRALEAAMVVQAPELDYERPLVPQETSWSGTGPMTSLPPSVPVALAEAEVSRAFEDRITRAAATRIDLDLLEDDIADTVLDLRRLHGDHATGAKDAPSAATAPAFAPCPYKGLAYFESTDAEYFFGRERLVAEMVARVAVERFVGLVGVSGSGKSSLLLAGLCPALQLGALPGSERWVTVLLTPGAEPIERLARALAGGVPGLLLDLVRARLRDDPDALERIARDAVTATSPGARLVVIVDQFEELFTMCRDDEERRRFVDTLTRPLGDPRTSVSVITSVRADYYAQCAALPELSPLLGATLGVGPMTERELRRAIELPAGRVGLQLEPGLTDVILTDLGNEPGGLPLLSTALLETWVRRDDSMLTIAGYEAAGGVSGALTHLAESVYERFSPEEQAACRRLLLRLAEPGEAGDDVRRRAPVAELVAPGDRRAATVLATLTDRRLVTAGADGIEVAHEALLREWPRARAWLEDDREGRRLHHRLAASAADWEAAGRDPAELYRGARLASALDWATAHMDEANPLEREFLETASAQHDAELRTARRSARRLRSLLVATAVLLVVAIAAGSLSLVQRGQARDRARAAELTRLATQAATLPPDQLGLALLLGVEARRLDPSETTAGALEAALAKAPPGLERLIEVPGGLGYANASTDGRRIVTGGRDGRARIVDVRSGRTVRTLDTDTDAGVGVANISPDGRLVVVTGIFGNKGEIQVFDARTGRPASAKLRTGKGVVLGQFLPNDSTRLVTASAKELIRWDLTDPKRPRPIGAPLAIPEHRNRPSALTILTISPDGRTAATSAAATDDFGPQGETFVWDLDSGARLLGPLPGRVARFNSDGTQLLLRGADRIAFVDAATGAERSSLPLGFAPGTGFAVSRDGQRIAVSGHGNGELRVFDLATGQPIGPSFTLFATASYPMAFLPGDRLLVGSQDQAAVWRYLDGTAAYGTLLPGHTGEVSARFTPDGKEIVTTGTVDHQVIRFRTRDGKPLGPGAPIPAGALSPDGATVAVPEARGIVSLWDRRTGTRSSVFPTGHETGVTLLAWSPAGAALATASGSDGQVVLWDVSNPRVPAERWRLDQGEPSTFLWRAPTFSPNGRVVAVNDYPRTGWVTLIDVARGRVLKKVPLGGQVGVPLVYSPDGKTILSNRYTEMSLLVLDAATLEVRATRQVSNWVQQWGFVHGGRRIFVQSVPGSGSVGPTTLRPFDATTLEPFGAPVDLPGTGVSVGGASPNGMKLLTGNNEGHAMLWDLNPRHWADIACRVAGRNLTRAEWQQYLPGREFHRTCPS